MSDQFDITTAFHQFRKRMTRWKSMFVFAVLMMIVWVVYVEFGLHFLHDGRDLTPVVAVSPGPT